MKRLLAYLFIVLGFGIILNDEAEASKWEIVYKNYLDGNIYSAKHKKKIFADAKAYQNCVKDKSSIKRQSKKITNNTWSYAQGDRAQNCLQFIIINPKGIEQNVWQTSVKNKVGNKIFETISDDLNKIMSIAKKTSRWSKDSVEDELGTYKYHCISRDYKKVRRERRFDGCGYGIDARTFLDIKMVSEVISDKYGHDHKLFWKKLLPLREEITQNYLKSLKTQIAKAEPRQTQKVAKSETTVKLVFKGQYVCLEGDTNCGKYSPSGPISFNKWKSRKSSFNENGLCMSPEFGTVFYLHTIDNCDHYEKTYSKKYYRLTNLKDNLFKIDGYLGVVAIKKFADPTGQGEGSSVVKIAKVEPSQTQKVAGKKSPNKFYLDIEFNLSVSSNSNVLIAGSKTQYEKITFERWKQRKSYFNASGLCFIPSYNRVNYYHSVDDCVGVSDSQAYNLKFFNTSGNRIYTFEVLGNKNQILATLDKSSETQIAKAEPTVKPKKVVEKKEKKNKKKVKVVKVEEPTQDEFKPKKTNQDKDPPTIEVAENITVSDSAYEIKGNVKDKSKKIFIEVDGQTILVKKGKFKLKRYSPVDEQIKIVAIDQWGNRSKPKIVNVTIDIKNIEIAEKIEPLNPTKMRSKKNKDRVALIIGIEKYDQTPSANFANLDAKYFYEYVRKGFGVSKSNIKLLIDEDANLVKSLGIINKWLPGKIKSDQTELIIFFAGHGLASSDGKELYILPQDSDPDLLDRTALSRTELFKEIIDLNPKSVMMFMDTCYSGISRDEKMLLASARPIRIVANEEEGIPDNFTIFSASQLDQISSGLSQAKHGIFSYYLMKGLEGYADANKDKNITNGELLAYMDENVSQKASELGRQQNPSLAGDPNKVLINY